MGASSRGFFFFRTLFRTGCIATSAVRKRLRPPAATGDNPRRTSLSPAPARSLIAAFPPSLQCLNPVPPVSRARPCPRWHREFSVMAITSERLRMGMRSQAMSANPQGRLAARSRFNLSSRHRVALRWSVRVQPVQTVGRGNWYNMDGRGMSRTHRLLKTG